MTRAGIETRRRRIKPLYLLGAETGPTVNKSCQMWRRSHFCIFWGVTGTTRHTSVQQDARHKTVGARLTGKAGGFWSRLWGFESSAPSSAFPQ